MVILDIKHSKYYEDGYHEGWCNFSVNDHEFFGYGGPVDYNTTEIDYWIERFTKLEHDLLIKSSYYFWQFDTDGCHGKRNCQSWIVSEVSWRF